MRYDVGEGKYFTYPSTVVGNIFRHFDIEKDIHTNLYRRIFYVNVGNVF